MLGKLGRNGAGVACGLNFLTCSADGGLDGVPIHVLLRLVLERCDDGAEARALLRRRAHGRVVVHHGGRRAPTCSRPSSRPAATRLVEPDADGWLVHTNHFLAAPRRGHDTRPRRSPARSRAASALARRRAAGRPSPSALAQHAPARGARVPARRSARTRLGGAARDAARRLGRPARRAARRRRAAVLERVRRAAV